jgi:hypothetical protein
LKNKHNNTQLCFCVFSAGIANQIHAGAAEMASTAVWSMLAAVAIAGVAALPVAIAITQFNERGTPYKSRAREVPNNGGEHASAGSRVDSASAGPRATDGKTSHSTTGPPPVSLAASSSAPTPAATATDAPVPLSPNQQTLADTLRAQSLLWAGTEDGDTLANFSAAADAAAAAATASAANARTAASATTTKSFVDRTATPLYNSYAAAKVHPTPEFPLTDAMLPLEPVDMVQNRLVLPPQRDAFDPRPAKSEVEKMQFDDNAAMVQRNVGSAYQHRQKRDDSAILNKEAMKQFELNKPPVDYTISRNVLGTPDVISTRGNLSSMPAAPMQHIMGPPSAFNNDVSEILQTRETSGDTTGASNPREMPNADAANPPMRTRTDHLEEPNRIRSFLPWHEQQHTDGYFADESATLRREGSTIVPTEKTFFSDSDLDAAREKLQDAAKRADPPVAVTTNWLAPPRTTAIATAAAPSSTASVDAQTKAEADMRFDEQTQVLQATADLKRNRAGPRESQVSNPSTTAQPTNGQPIGPDFGNMAFRPLQITPNLKGWIPSNDSATTAHGNGAQTLPTTKGVPEITGVQLPAAQTVESSGSVLTFTL